MMSLRLMVALKYFSFLIVRASEPVNELAQWGGRPCPPRREAAFKSRQPSRNQQNRRSAAMAGRDAHPTLEPTDRTGTRKTLAVFSLMFCGLALVFVSSASCADE